MQEIEKILEEIENTFKENIENIEDENGVHHFVIDSFTATFLAKEIIRKHMNDGWIPVEERMPERTPDEKINNSYKKYLVFIDNIDYWDIDIAVYDLWNDKKWREFSNTYCEIENVTAWCSLPDPYKKIQEENK
ncbi:DUF551 domain-containing protein [Sellimonas intestinalis]|uniref:DUF551 domain-containing protein n=1 Tax=Sellimonas intestinalis TaxID=1653434 RepID=UPI003AB2FF69